MALKNRPIVLLFTLAFVWVSSHAQSADDIKLGIAPVQPFRIAANIYYVGTIHRPTRL